MRAYVCVIVATAAMSLVATDAGAGGAAHTTLTVWSGPSPTPTAQVMPNGAYGGLGYAGYSAPSGALVTEQREVDVGSGGDIRITGVPATIDPASVQLHSITDPGATIVEQRFVPGATTPTEILAHHVGDTITVVTPKGEVSGVLRSVDEQTLVLEVGAGDQRHLQILRRDTFVQDVRLPAGGSLDKPSLAWRLATKKPGKQQVEIAYRADGMTWTADYLAVLDEQSGNIDFSAWATIHNGTGAAFDDADVTLVSMPGSTQTTVNQYGQVVPARASGVQSRFPVPSHVKIGVNETVQVELVPAKAGAKSRTVILYDTWPEAQANIIPGNPMTECAVQFNGLAAVARTETDVEIDVPSKTPLPDGRVRMFRRKAATGADHLEMVSDDQLRSSAGEARVRLSAADSDVAVTRNIGSCATDETRRRTEEKIELEVESKAKTATDVIVREPIWRSTTWRIDPKSETVPGTKAGSVYQEYRVKLSPGQKKTLSYTVEYSW